MAQPGMIRANLLPDLLVSEVRVENDSTAWFKVTNQGTADAVGNIMLFTVAYIDGLYADPPYPLGFENLAMSESKWVKVSGYALPTDRYSATGDKSFPLTQATAFTTNLDPKVSSSTGWFGTPQPGQSLDDMLTARKTCTEERGCIPELDEKNNRDKFAADRIGHGKPE